MRMQFRAIAAAVLLLCASAAAASRQETITIRLRHGYAYCAGVCPNFAMTVYPSGKVVSQEFWSGATIHRYRVRPRQLAIFRELLDRIKRPGERRLDVWCRRALGDDGKPDPLHDPRPDDIEVRWDGPSSHARLTSCSDSHRPVRETIVHAVLALGADLNTGERERRPR